MLVKMNKTKTGSENGFSVKQFKKGEIYDVQDMLARSFIKEGYATKIDDVLTYYYNCFDVLQQTLNKLDKLTDSVNPEHMTKLKILNLFGKCEDIMTALQYKLIEKQNINASASELDELTRYTITKTQGEV